MEEVDLEAEFQVEQPSSDAVLLRLRTKIQEMLDQYQLVDQLESDLSQAKQALHELRTSTVPSLMAEIQSDHFAFRGYDIKIEDLVSGSLPKEPAAREKAIEWLEAHDAGGLLKIEVSVAFGKGAAKEAYSLAKELENEKKLAPSLLQSVHPQTLMAWARQQIQDGNEIDPEVLGLYVGKIAKIKELK